MSHGKFLEFELVQWNGNARIVRVKLSLYLVVLVTNRSSTKGKSFVTRLAKSSILRGVPNNEWKTRLFYRLSDSAWPSLN